MVNRIRGYAKGTIIGGLNTFQTVLLVLNKIVRWKHLDATLSVESLESTESTDRIYVRNFIGGAGDYEVPRIGTKTRPSLFSLRGILAKRKVSGEFVVQNLRVSGLPCSTNTKAYRGTDCYLGTGGIGSHLRTDSEVIIQHIGSVRFSERTDWDTFGDDLGE